MNYVRARTGRARCAMHIKTIWGDLEKKSVLKNNDSGGPQSETLGWETKIAKNDQNRLVKLFPGSYRIQKCKRKLYRSNSRKVTTFRRTLVGDRWHVARVV